MKKFFDFKKYDFFLNILIRDISFFGSLIFYCFVMFLFLFFFEFEMFLSLLLSLFFSIILIILIRFFYFKQRPKIQNYNNFLEKISASSFPSGHALRSSILFFNLSFFFLNNLFLLLFYFILFILVLFSRWISKKHYFSDIFFGVIIGFFIFFLIKILLNY